MHETAGTFLFARILARGDVRFNASLTPFRHLGFFPDMAAQWDWMRPQLQAGGASDAEVLNLFGYTGVGTLLLSDAHARLVHVDASKKSVDAGKENARLSGMSDRPIRWIVDDASKFTAREVRRGRRYDGILLDPPKFGRGPEGEATAADIEARTVGSRQLNSSTHWSRPATDDAPAATLRTGLRTAARSLSAVTNALRSR